MQPFAWLLHLRYEPVIAILESLQLPRRNAWCCLSEEGRGMASLSGKHDVRICT